MAVHTGVEGEVKVGTVTVAQITEFSVNQSSTFIDNSVLAGLWMTYIPDRNSWTASFSAHWDEEDTTGQGALTIGATVTLNLYPEGSTTGDRYWSGSAVINDIGITVAIGSTIKASFSAQGNGILNYLTVA